MKIIIAHGGDISNLEGPTIRIMGFMDAMLNNDFDVELVVPTPKNNIPKELDNVLIHEVPIKARGIANQPLRALYISNFAKKIANKSKGFLQIEHATLGGFASLVGCKDYVLDMHDLSFSSPLFGSIPLAPEFIYRIERIAVKRAQKVIVVSNRMKDFISKEWGAKREDIYVIPNGYFKEKIAENIKKINNPYEDAVCFLGSLHPKLDVKKFVLVGKLLKHRGGSLYIIGDGSIRKSLEAEMRSHGLDNVIFTGRIPDIDMYRLIAKSKVAILPERYSIHTSVSCPVKLFDYAALGIAIVADNISETCELFRENNAALISDPDDSREFLQNVEVLLDSEVQRNELATNAKRLVENFSWYNQGNKLVQIYRNLECLK